MVFTAPDVAERIMRRYLTAFDKVAGPVFLFFGVVFFAVGLFDIDRARRSNSWPATWGVIVRSWRGEHSEVTFTMDSGHAPKLS